MRVLVYSPGPPSRSDALIRFFVNWLTENGHGIGWRYFGAYNEYEPCDVVLTIGWNTTIGKIHSDHRETGKDSLAISDGFIQRGWNPGSYFAMTRNGLHAYGDQVDLMPSDRWVKLGVKLRPWQENKDGHILIAHQHTVTYEGKDRQAWFHSAVDILRQQTNRQLILRPHPRDKNRVDLPGCLVSTRSFREDLEKAFAVATYDSNMAVDALLYGVKVFTGGKTKADPLALHDLTRLEEAYTPDRQQWAHNLAYCQWNTEELACGLPWLHLIGGRLANKASGIAEQVEEPAKEADYEYAESWEALQDQLTDWNVKPGQTPEDVMKELTSPKIADAMSARRTMFAGMSTSNLVQFLIDKGLRANNGESRELLIGRAIHSTL